MTMFRRALRIAALAAVAGLSVAATAPAGPDDVRIDGTGIFPESLDADKAGRLYIGSVPGIVFRTDPNGNVAKPWIRPTAENGLMSLLGIVVDEKRRTLWVCSSPMPFRTPPAVGVSSVTAFDLATGTFKASYPFPAPAAACNDIAIARDGTLYATDTPNGRIMRLRPGGTALEPFAADAGLKGIDGLAFAADGTMYGNNVQKNQLLRINRGKDGAYRDFTVLTASAEMKGPDGLRPIGGNRFLQAEGGSGRITLVTIKGHHADIRLLRDGLDSSPGVTMARGRVYAVEGKITYLVDPKLKGQSPEPFLARAIPFKPAK